MRGLIALALVIGVCGCSLGRDSGAQDTELIRQNKETRDMYGPLVGTYSGKLLGTNHGDEDCELIIYIVDVQETLPDGSRGTRSEVLAVFRRNHPVVADYTFKVGGLTREESQIGLSSPPDGNSELASISLKISGRHLSGPVATTKAGTLGRLELDWVSVDTTPATDLNDRLIRQYQSVQGEYVGGIPSTNRKISISLSATVVDNGKPRLDGFYKNLNVPEGYVDLPLTVVYRPELSPAAINLHGRGSGRYELNMEGTLERGVMRVAITSPFYQGYLGVAELVRKEDPAGGSDQLYKKYVAIAGLYKGDLVAKGKATSVSMELQAGINGKVPVLRCLYQPSASAADGVLLTVDYDPSKGEVEFTGKDADGRLIRFTGLVKAGVLDLKLIRDKKVAATARLIR